jgi:hypothetical protein
MDVLLIVYYVVGEKGEGYGILCSAAIKKGEVDVSVEVEERDSRQTRWEGARPTRYFHFA